MAIVTDDVKQLSDFTTDKKALTTALESCGKRPGTVTWQQLSIDGFDGDRQRII
jgi:hypothetical protein